MGSEPATKGSRKLHYPVASFQVLILSHEMRVVTHMLLRSMTTSRRLSNGKRHATALS